LRRWACRSRAGRAATSTSAPVAESVEAPTSTRGEGCGVTLADVQALLPTGSRVTENSTPDAGRCNFTWDDGGPRGIDVAFVPGGRSAFEVPAGYQSLDGYGDEAFLAAGNGRASAFAFVGNDLYAASEVNLRDLCLQLLELSLH